MLVFIAICCIIMIILLAWIVSKVNAPSYHNEGIITGSEEVLAAVRKSRELVLQEIAMKRAHEAIAWDSVVADTKEIRKDTSWLRAAWDRFSRK